MKIHTLRMLQYKVVHQTYLHSPISHSFCLLRWNNIFLPSLSPKSPDYIPGVTIGARERAKVTMQASHVQQSVIADPLLPYHWGGRWDILGVSSKHDLCQTSIVAGQSDCSIPVDYIPHTRKREHAYFYEGKGSS